VIQAEVGWVGYAPMSARAERTLGLLRELSGSHDAAPGDRLEDVGIDSLGLAELAVAIEREFGWTSPTRPRSTGAAPWRPLIVVACPRSIVFMAKKELFRNAFLSWWLLALGGFRVDRDRFDLRAVRVALSVLRCGKVLGMYPEGTRSPGELRPFLGGAAWVALLTGAPIVPCAISGTERTRDARRPGIVKVRVSFAAPIGVDRVDDPAERRARAPELTAEVRTAIERRLAGSAEGRDPGGP